MFCGEPAMSTAPAPQAQSAPGLSRLIVVPTPGSSGAWTDALAGDICHQLETGHIVLFPESPIDIAEQDRELLLGRKQVSSAYHKNIAYRPAEDRVTGLDASEQAEAAELRRILQWYSQAAAAFLSGFLLPYAGKWKLDYASFRPVEEHGRAARLHARNDLLHFDSFPTRPTNGSRILRFFSNINPVQNRVWITSQTFESFGPHFAGKTGYLDWLHSPFSRGLSALARTLRLPGSRRPPYDELMHRCHNAMKEDAAFQDTTPKSRWEFPPNSSWMVFTDCVSHAVLSGQYALEQTFLIPQSVLVEPPRSPLAILEKLAGTRLTL
jgi:3-deoxy-D-manno-oct-2-ulosonic acid (Kdo) hydroxylase